MTRTITLTALTALALGHCHCQDLAKAPAFEVASITPCKPGTPEPPGEHAGMVQFTSPGGRFRASATTLKYLFEWAYDIQPSQHSSGPSWMGNDRYDVIAKAENFQRSAAAPVGIVAPVSMNTIWNRKRTITPTSYVPC